MIYKAKVDTWIRIILLFTVAITLPVILVVPENEVLIGLLFLLPIDGLLLWILYGAHYELTQDYIHIIVGPFRQKIYYDKIKSYREVRSWLSSMALSSDRIEIRVHNKSFIMGTTHIAPLEKQKFMDELRRRCKNLEE